MASTQCPNCKDLVHTDQKIRNVKDKTKGNRRYTNITCSNCGNKFSFKS